MSNFFVEFLLGVPHRYSFEAAFTASGNHLENSGVWQTQLEGLTTGFLVSGAASETVVRTGLLDPGVYQFLVGAASSSHNSPPGPAAFGAFSGFDFTLRLIPVDDGLPAPTPEPASLFLLGSGLAGIAAGARRRREIR